MAIKGHKFLQIESPTYNYIKPNCLYNISEGDRPRLFGLKQGLAIAFISISGMGKTTALLSLPSTFMFALMGETVIVDEDSVKSKFTGYPANLPNLHAILKQSQGFLAIDSLSALHPGESRLGGKGIDLTQFELMLELDALAAERGHVICFSYNPFDSELYNKALKEVEGRLRVYVQMLDGYKCQVMNPLTRKFSAVMKNTEVWSYVTAHYTGSSNPASVKSYY